jgi:multiple sugar transport system substrate-binding protein
MRAGGKGAPVRSGRKRMFRRVLIVSAALAGLIAGWPAAATELTILWAEWDPANYLQELANEYEKKTGVKVTVETVNWPDFQNKAFTEFNAHDDAYDLVVGDSQWLGAGATEGHYVELSDLVKELDLTKVMTPASMTYYSEYPQGSSRYWAVPLEADAIGWAYRKDWFEDPSEMKAFKEKYDYDLAPPKTWKELRDIAQFFYRPHANPPRYGIAIYTEKNGDGLAMGFMSELFSTAASSATTPPARLTASSTRPRPFRRWRPIRNSTPSLRRTGLTPRVGRKTWRSPVASRQ